MNVVVIGAGAVGGYFGGRLQQAGHDVTYLVRERRAKQLADTGLVIESPFGNATLNPRVITHVDDSTSADLVLLTVKNYHLQAVLPAVKALTARGAKILPLLNGVEHFHTLQHECGESAVLGGVVQIIATLNGQGHVIHSNQLHHIRFGPLHPQAQSFCEQLAGMCRAANLSLQLSADVRVDIWQKYAFITAFSGVTTASRLTIDEVFAHEGTRQVYEQALREMCELAGASQVQLPDTFVQAQLTAMERMPKGATSSMHQDFRKGLPLEADSLQGAAVRLAEQVGVVVPTVKTLYGLLQPYMDGPIG